MRPCAWRSSKADGEEIRKNLKLIGAMRSGCVPGVVEEGAATQEHEAPELVPGPDEKRRERGGCLVSGRPSLRPEEPDKETDEVEVKVDSLPELSGLYLVNQPPGFPRGFPRVV